MLSPDTCLYWGFATRYVQEVAADCVWVALSPALRGRLHALDAALDLAQLRTFAERFKPGQPLRCTVMQVRAQLLRGACFGPMCMPGDVLDFMECTCVWSVR